MNQSHIRNFCIIAHIDHGKSTLADRLLEFTQTVEKRQMQEQLLDSNPIERERGITIQLTPVRMEYSVSMSQSVNVSRKSISPDTFDPLTQRYVLNLIDTPGHVDFSYEVSRSLAACEGAVLVVDATQGIQAQTLSNLNLARKQKLTIIPVLNKIDLPNAEIDRCLDELVGLGFEADEVIQISAKTGLNVEKVLAAIIERIPSPSGDEQKVARGLIFSSQYDQHKGVVIYVRMVDGVIEATPNSEVYFCASKGHVVPLEVGYFTPSMKAVKTLKAGEVGYIATGLKDVSIAKVGDTVSLYIDADKKVEPLAGYKEPKSMVFLGLFPVASNEYQEVREAVSKLKLSDSAFNFRPISSLALGNGFHCGFLGLLHAEVVQERLSREFGLSLLATAPNVEYLLKLSPNVLPSKVGLHQSDERLFENETWYSIQSATQYPDRSFIDDIKEPMMNLTIFVPKKYVGAVMQLCQDKRGEYIDLEYLSSENQLDDSALARFNYIMPLSEMIIDFFDELKSVSSGYASLDYEFFDYQEVDVVKLDIVINYERVDAFAQLVVRSRAVWLGRRIVEKLAEVIPRRQFLIPIQAAIGGEIIARSDVKPFRKDVTAKLYGGDRTRKDKLLDKQREGKKKMKSVGNVEIPQEAFLKVFSRT